MAGNVMFLTFFTQVLLQTSLGVSLVKPEEDSVTSDVDVLPQPEIYDEQTVQASEEYDDWDEWDDYEEDPVNKCNLTSYEKKNKASYLCQDGTAWSVDIQQTEDEKCIYSRNVKNPSGENEIKKTAVDCNIAREWLEDLLQYEVFSGIPDMFLFNYRKTDSENSPINSESIPTPINNK